MKLQRDISGSDLAKLMSRLGYTISHQSGSHMRLTTSRGGIHHITIPVHSSLHIGTLNAIVRDVAEHHKMTRNKLLDLLFS